MRVVLIGEVRFSLAMLREINESPVDVAAVITRAHSPGDSDKVDLMPFANEIGVPCRVVKSINNAETVAWLSSLRPDAMFCLGWSEILREEVLNICPGKIIGYHPSNLPRHRGRHPIIWSLVLGLRKTASTFFFMDEGTDSGDIISQEPVPIGENDYASDLYGKVVDVARMQVREICDGLVKNRLIGIPQDPNRATYWRKRNADDGVIDWRMSSHAIRNLVRALADPYPGATFLVRDDKLVCREARVIPNNANDVEPGKILSVSDSSLVVKTADGAVELSRLSAAPGVREGDYI